MGHPTAEGVLLLSPSVDDSTRGLISPSGLVCRLCPACVYWMARTFSGSMRNGTLSTYCAFEASVV